LIIECAEALSEGKPVVVEKTVTNVNRSVGTMLGSHLTRRWGGEGLPADTIRLRLTGSAGQSLGAFIPRGITIELTGDANDYVAKGLSGGRVVIKPPTSASFAPEENVIAGNVIGYGATSGELFISGMVGERFCVRNSGAVAVVEGVGDHGCEYMTGGRVVVLGATGRNFAAGMSGGDALVLDVDGGFGARVNYEMVDVVDLDDSDFAWLKDRLARHVEATGSPLASRILDGWSQWSTRFRKVMPRDYARVMKALDDARSSGASDAETWQRVMASQHG
jgi:glutamate synthase (NADPH/NADH) large chain